MDMGDIIGPQQVLAKVRVPDKAQLLHELARRAAQALGLDIRAILDPLLAREQLGSTGVGSGIALPHAKVAGLDRLYGLFARLERPIDFASVDERPVDLVCLLLTPPAATAEHLSALATLSRRLRQRDVAAALRDAGAADTLYRALVDVGSAGMANRNLT